MGWSSASVDPGQINANSDAASAAYVEADAASAAAASAQSKIAASSATWAGTKPMVVTTILSADGTWTGPTQTITAGENLAKFELAYLKSDGKYWRADADAADTSKGKLVMATAAISADATGLVLLSDPTSFIRDDATTKWTVTAAGDVMYVSLAVGEITNDISAYTAWDVLRVVGFMETATILHFNVDSMYAELG